jgi:hypothetical protein
MMDAQCGAGERRGSEHIRNAARVLVRRRRFGAGDALVWQWKTEFGTEVLSLLGLGVTWAIITASALVTIFRAQQKLWGMIRAIPRYESGDVTGRRNNPVPRGGYISMSKSIFAVPSYSLSAPCSNSSCAKSWRPR